VATFWVSNENTGLLIPGLRQVAHPGMTRIEFFPNGNDTSGQIGNQAGRRDARVCENVKREKIAGEESDQEIAGKERHAEAGCKGIRKAEIRQGNKAGTGGQTGRRG
jgi:hypothetical protein